MARAVCLFSFDLGQKLEAVRSFVLLRELDMDSSGRNVLWYKCIIDF